MEFFHKMTIGAGKNAFVLTEGGIISYSIVDGQITTAEILLIAAGGIGGGLVQGIVYLLGGDTLRFRTRDGEIEGPPTRGSTRRRERGRRYTARR